MQQMQLSWMKQPVFDSRKRDMSGNWRTTALASLWLVNFTIYTVTYTIKEKRQRDVSFVAKNMIFRHMTGIERVWIKCALITHQSRVVWRQSQIKRKLNPWFKIAIIIIKHSSYATRFKIPHFYFRRIRVGPINDWWISPVAKSMSFIAKAYVEFILFMMVFIKFLRYFMQVETMTYFRVGHVETKRRW